MANNTNNSKVVDLSPKEWDEFYESQGSQYLHLESAALKAHGDDQKKLLYEVFGSVKTLVQTIGVVAGFGFTAMAFVKSLPLFLGGELFFLSAIFAGLWWNHRAYASNFIGSRDEMDRIKGLFATRFAVFKAIYDTALAQLGKGEGLIRLPEADVAALQAANRTLMDKMITEAPAGEKKQDPFLWLMLLFASGSVLALMSFTGHGAVLVAHLQQWLF